MFLDILDLSTTYKSVEQKAVLYLFCIGIKEQVWGKFFIEVIIVINFAMTVINH